MILNIFSTFDFQVSSTILAQFRVDDQGDH